MRAPRSTVVKLRFLAVVTVAAAVAGALYALGQSRHPNETPLGQALAGALIGGTIGLSVLGFGVFAARGA